MDPKGNLLPRVNSVEILEELPPRPPLFPVTLSPPSSQQSSQQQQQQQQQQEPTSAMSSARPSIVRTSGGSLMERINARKYPHLHQNHHGASTTAAAAYAARSSAMTNDKAELSRLRGDDVLDELSSRSTNISNLAGADCHDGVDAFAEMCQETFSQSRMVADTYADALRKEGKELESAMEVLRSHMAMAEAVKTDMEISTSNKNERKIMTISNFENIEDVARFFREMAEPAQQLRRVMEQMPFDLEVIEERAARIRSEMTQEDRNDEDNDPDRPQRTEADGSAVAYPRPTTAATASTADELLVQRLRKNMHRVRRQRQLCEGQMSRAFRRTVHRIAVSACSWNTNYILLVLNQVAGIPSLPHRRAAKALMEKHLADLRKELEQLPFDEEDTSPLLRFDEMITKSLKNIQLVAPPKVTGGQPPQQPKHYNKPTVVVDGDDDPSLSSSSPKVVVEAPTPGRRRATLGGAAQPLPVGPPLSFSPQASPTNGRGVFVVGRKRTTRDEENEAAQHGEISGGMNFNKPPVGSNTSSSSSTAPPQGLQRLGKRPIDASGTPLRVARSIVRPTTPTPESLIVPVGEEFMDDDALAEGESTGSSLGDDDDGGGASKKKQQQNGGGGGILGFFGWK